VQARGATYLPAGYLLLSGFDALKAVAFDARRLTVTGEPFVVLDSVTANGSVGGFAVAQNGTAVYTVLPRRGGGDVPMLVDLEGREERLPLPVAGYESFRFSPDGRRLAYTTYGGGADTLWVHDLLLGTTSHRAVGALDHAWTPDGAGIVYSGTRRGDSVFALVSIRADGSGRPDTLLTERLSPTAAFSYPRLLAVSPDGHRMLFMRRGTQSIDLLVARWDSTFGPVTDYLAANWNETYGALSPDGKWVAYISDEERSTPGAPGSRVYVRSFPEPGERYTVSDSLGRYPRWSPDGRIIYYWRGNTLVAASVRTEPTFAVTAQRDLFTRPDAYPFGFDVHPDGKRFVMAVTPTVSPAGGPVPAFGQTRLVLVVNWLEEFRRKAKEAER